MQDETGINYVSGVFAKAAVKLFPSIRSALNTLSSSRDDLSRRLHNSVQEAAHSKSVLQETREQLNALGVELDARYHAMTELQSKLYEAERAYTLSIQTLHTRIEQLESEVDSPPAPPKRDILNMPFELGDIKGTVYGGPYRQKPEDIAGVKMAEEINLPCSIDVPTADFSVPDVAELRLGLLQAALILKRDGELYVGCMGGTGRTGLFMAGLAKMMEAAGRLDSMPRSGKLPKSIGYVRAKYKPHAVETREQERYIDQLYVADLVALL